MIKKTQICVSVTPLTCVLLSFNISGLISSVVDCWHSMPDAMGFEFQLRFDFSPSVTFGTQCDPQPQVKSLILYHIS